MECENFWATGWKSHVIQRAEFKGTFLWELRKKEFCEKYGHWRPCTRVFRGDQRLCGELGHLCDILAKNLCPYQPGAEEAAIIDNQVISKLVLGET